MKKIGQKGVDVSKILLCQWRIQDFPEEGAPTLKEAIIWPFFSQKLHEIERIWTPRGGARPWRSPLDPPMYVDPPLAINNSKYRGSTSTIQFFLVSESVSQLLLVTDQSRFMTSALSADIIKQNIRCGSRVCDRFADIMKRIGVNVQLGRVLHHRGTVLKHPSIH